MPMNVICLGCGDEMFANVLVCDCAIEHNTCLCDMRGW